MIFSESFGKKYSSNLSFGKKCPRKSVLVVTFYILLVDIMEFKKQLIGPTKNICKIKLVYLTIQNSQKNFKIPIMDLIKKQKNDNIKYQLVMLVEFYKNTAGGLILQFWKFLIRFEKPI